MAAQRPKGKDFGAAIAGLVLGGSVLFLVMLTIVWLTNSHFADLKESGAHGAAPSQQTSPPAVPSTTGSGTTAPAAPTAAPAPAPAGH